jgi:hypothetical protein
MQPVSDLQLVQHHDAHGPTEQVKMPSLPTGSPDAFSNYRLVHHFHLQDPNLSTSQQPAPLISVQHFTFSSRMSGVYEESVFGSVDKDNIV